MIVAVVPYVPTRALPLLQRDTFTFESALAYDGGEEGSTSCGASCTRRPATSSRGNARSRSRRLAGRRPRRRDRGARLPRPARDHRRRGRPARDRGVRAHDTSGYGPGHAGEDARRRGVVRTAAGGLRQRRRAVDLDRVGQADAPKTLKLQINSSYSPQASTSPTSPRASSKLYARLGAQPPRLAAGPRASSPDTQTTTEQSRLLENGAREPRRRTARTWTPSRVPLFIQQKALTPLDEHFSKAGARRPLPVRARRHHRPRRPHLRAGGGRPTCASSTATPTSCPSAPKTWDELLAAAKKARSTTRRRRRLPVQRRPLGGARRSTTSATSGCRAGSCWATTGEPRVRAGRQRARRCSTSCKLPAQADRRRRHAEPRHDLRQTYDELATAAQGKYVAMFLGGSFQWPTMKARLAKEHSPSGRSPRSPGTQPGQTATGTGGWTMARLHQGPREGRGVRLDPQGTIYIGKGNELTGELPTHARTFNALKAVQRADLQDLPQASSSTGRRARACRLPGALERAADRDRQRPHRLRDARGARSRRPPTAPTRPTSC